MKKDDKKIITAWTIYDWANSVYPLVITSSIFPIYYATVTKSEHSDKVHFLGMDFVNTALYSYALSVSFLFIAFISPVLSAIADYRGNKKRFMQFFCYMGALSCCSLYFFDSSHLWIGITGFMLATIGFSGSIVFYNAYLPEIARSEIQDKVSARGFAMGYVGSSLLLIFNLTMILHPEWYGITESSFPARFSFLMVGIWWVLFAQIPFYFLPDNVYGKKPQGNIITKGYGELIKVWKELHRQQKTKWFLTSFFFYNMGVQAVMNVAVLFGTKELKLESGQLIITVLLIQFVAIFGAFLFSFLSKKYGNINAVVAAIMVWLGICTGAYFVHGAGGFYILAAVVGMVMGGIQSLSRSTYSKLLPSETTAHASYFSFYDVCDKLGYVTGIASFGLIEEITGSMRNSILALMLFFLVGFTVLIVARKKRVFLEIQKENEFISL